MNCEKLINGLFTIILIGSPEYAILSQEGKHLIKASSISSLGESIIQYDPKVFRQREADTRFPLSENFWILRYMNGNFRNLKIKYCYKILPIGRPGTTPKKSLEPARRKSRE